MPRSGAPSIPPIGIGLIPTIELIEIDGQWKLLVTLFVPMEGAKGDEAGELIYYRTYEPAA